MNKFKPKIELSLKPTYPNRKNYKKYLKKTTKYWFYLI